MEMAMPVSPSVVAVVVLGVMIYVYSRSRRSGSRRLPYPPGPKGAPLIGNVLQIPLKGPWVKWAEWAAEYGGLIYQHASQ